MKDKAGKLSGGSRPGLLVIGSEHPGADAVIGWPAAEALLTGDPLIEVQFGGSGDTAMTTQLWNSAFFAGSSDGVVAKRQSVSAVLLASLWPRRCVLVGLLHPDPVRPFETSLLPDIPFVKLREWPVRRGRLETVWTHEDPRGYQVDYEVKAL
ncbi:MAG: hypothetical protein GY838_03000 [bacterium]|nr:hypothetical protein [bacterium]